jgi:hypothetical protein
MQLRSERCFVSSTLTWRAEVLDQETQDGNAMAQRLLAAPDRYGIERLKLISQ